MRFGYESSTETEESELENGGQLPMDVKGKGKAREISKSASPRRSLSVRISVPPRSAGKVDDRSRLRPSTSSDSSVSEQDDDTSSDDDDEDDSSSGETSDVFSDSDSEEDEFPVNPTKADLANRRRLSQYPAQSDPLESYLAKQQKKAWQQAQASHNRDLAALRSIRLNAFTQASEQRKKQEAEELELTRMLLEGLNMKRQKEEEEIDREFKSRNQARWNEINRTIANLEKAENEAALAIARKRELEAEEKAKKMREEELKKIEAEKEQEKKRLEEQQKKDKELQDQKVKAQQAANERARQEKEQADKSTTGQLAGGAAPITSASSATTPASSGSYLLDCKRDFEQWHAKIKELKETVLPAVSNNKDLKNACWKLKRSLTTRISNVSASREDIQNTSAAIHGLLNDAKSASEQAYLWSINLLSKKLTEMAGNNSEHDLSPVTFALGQVVVALLLAGHEPLGQILMARLVKRCPYIVPFFPSKGTLSPEEHSKLLGRKEGEPPISYKQRMSGMISLYAAIVQTSPGDVPRLSPTPSLSSIPSHFRPEGGWRWLALIVRPPLPLLEVTPLLLQTFLRMTSERFHTLFGRQYIKLLSAIAEQAIDQRRVKWNDGVQGDLSKIRLMIGEWMEKGQIVGAEGRIPT